MIINLFFKDKIKKFKIKLFLNIIIYHFFINNFFFLKKGVSYIYNAIGEDYFVGAIFFIYIYFSFFVDYY